MSDESYPNMCIFHTLDGLREGLSHFSEPSRVALIYAVRSDDQIRVYDLKLGGVGESRILMKYVTRNAILPQITGLAMLLGSIFSGALITEIVFSYPGIGTLLYMGIGDTIRVSLTAHPREEVIAGYEILKSLDLRQHGPVLVSCPSCGRTEVDLISLAEEVADRLAVIKKPIKVAVMGCVVNGPGEARDADIGIACGKGRGVLFRKGEKLRTIEEKDFVKVLMAEVERL